MLVLARHAPLVSMSRVVRNLTRPASPDTSVEQLTTDFLSGILRDERFGEGKDDITQL